MNASDALHVLFVTPYLPSLIRVRPFNLIKALAAQGHRISLLALHPPGDDAGGLSDLRGWCEWVRVVPLPRWRPLWNALQVLPGDTPFQAAYSRSPQMVRAIRQTLERNHFDVAHLEHLRGAEFGEALEGLPVVFDSVDSIALLFERALRQAPRWQSRFLARLDLARTRRYEGQLLHRFRRVLVTSPEDREMLLRLTPPPVPEERLIVLPNGVDLRYFRPMGLERRPDTLIFSGKMSYHANVAAALYLVQEVMPHIWARRPQVQVWIVGKDPPSVVRELAADDRVLVTGTVPDLRPYLAQAAVAITPLRYSVGIQNKVLEAMAMGTPVVTTPATCRALAVEPGRDLLVAETPAGLAEAVLSLLADEARRRQMGRAARRYVETHHDWNAVAARLGAIYREVVTEG